MASHFFEYARVASKALGIIFFVLYLRAKERDRKLEFLMLATFCMAA